MVTVTKFVKALHTSSLLCPRTIGTCLRRAFAVRGPQGGHSAGGHATCVPSRRSTHSQHGAHRAWGAEVPPARQRHHSMGEADVGFVTRPWTCLGGSAKFRGLLLCLGQVMVCIQDSLRSLRYAAIRLKIGMEECKLR